jgi:hypothetical protein
VLKKSNRRHEPGDFFDRRFLRDLYYLIAHYGFDLFAFLGNEIGRRNQADDLSLFLLRGVADLVLDQKVCQHLNRKRWAHGNGLSGHYGFRFHSGLLSFGLDSL